MGNQEGRPRISDVPGDGSLVKMGRNRIPLEGRPITTTQAARLVKVSPATMLRAVVSKKIPSFKTPGGHHRLNREDVLEFFKVGRTRTREMEEELKENRALFELQHVRVAEASRHWQRETRRRHIHPDIGQLVAWLMDKAKLKYKNTGLGKGDPRLHAAWRKKWAP